MPPLTAWDMARPENLGPHPRSRHQLTGRWERGRMCPSRRQDDSSSGVHGHVYHQESSVQVSQGQTEVQKPSPSAGSCTPQLEAHASSGEMTDVQCCLPPSPLLQLERRFLKQRSLKKLQSPPRSKQVLEMPGSPETRRGHRGSSALGHDPTAHQLTGPQIQNQVPPLWTGPQPMR